MMHPMPHSSPCSPFPGASRSMACENMCSEPEVGRDEPATDIEMPDMMIGRMATHTLSSWLGLMTSALSMIVSAV